ncbi:unnamed protein product, partial [marine sediment metagenome]
LERAKAWEESVRRELCFPSVGAVQIVEYRLDRPGNADLSVAVKI